MHNHTRLTQHLAVHVIELPKLPREVPVPHAPAVLRWGRFLAARSDEELERIAMSDPEPREAKSALEELSQDPQVRRLAEERRLAAMNYRLSMAQARKEGREEGREQGIELGRIETLRRSIEQLCHRQGVAMTEARRTRLRAVTVDAAQALFDHLVAYGSWPD